jgi:hypothetical protein
MNAYRVAFKIKNGGYQYADQVTEGGYYDKHDAMLVYAQTKTQASTITKNYHSAQKIMIKNVTLLMEIK